MTQIVRFRPGQQIDPRKILEIVALPASSEHWEEIGRAYPEIRAAGPRASFRGRHNVTIHPPMFVSAKLLKQLCGYEDDQRHIYPLSRGGQVTGLLVHVGLSQPIRNN